MASLNIRNFPPDLKSSLKCEAAEHDQTLHDYVVALLLNRGRVTGKPEPESARLRQRVGHDPKTCRTYKCGLCAAAKA